MYRPKKLVDKVFAILLSFILILSLCSPSIAMVSANTTEGETNEAFLPEEQDSNAQLSSPDTVTIENFNQQLFTTMSISQEEKLSQLIEKTIDYYLSKNKLTSWQELVALWGAGEDLSQWELPEWITKQPSNYKANSYGTEQIQYIFGLLAAGKDPSKAWETNTNLYEDLASQQIENGSIGGINKHLFAMLALKTGKELGHYSWDDAKEQKALEFLLNQEISGGGFALFGDYPDTDITGMVILTLGLYQNDTAVQATIERAKAILKQKQLDNGGFISDGDWGSGDNANSLAAAVSGLVAVGEDLSANEWIKDQTIIDTYERFQLENGSFKWKPDDTNTNSAATEQALISLLDIQNNQSTWHRFADEWTKEENHSEQPSDDKEEDGSGNDSTNPDEQVVYISIEKRAIGEGNILPKTKVTLQDGDTAFSILQRVTNERGIDLYYTGSNESIYIQGIDGLWEFDYGPLSGWIYAVNNETPSVSSGIFTVQNGDFIRYQYTTDLGNDLEDEYIATASLTVDGIDEQIVQEKLVDIIDGQITALDVLKEGLGSDIPYEIVHSSFGPYVNSIDGLEAGSLGGWDGWMYKVNGEEVQVGASDYKVKDGDSIQFYYGRWADISTVSFIEYQIDNPSITISLKGDRFTENAQNNDYWNVDTGNTALQLQSIVRIDNQKVELQFNGKANGGTISIQALPGGIEGEYSSNTIAIDVVQEISDSENKTIKVGANEQEIKIISNGEKPTNVVTLNFDTNDLPKLEANRGNVILFIPSGTKVVTGDWNKSLEIPSNIITNITETYKKINSKLEGKEVKEITAHIKVGGNIRIDFNQHVTLIFKGLGDKEAGFIDQSGVFTPIQKVNEHIQPQPEVYAYAKESDLIVKTKHFTEFLAYQAVVKEQPEDEQQNNGSGSGSGGSGGPSTKNKTVYISIEKRSIGERDILSKTKVTFHDGDTVFDVLKQIADEKGIDIDYTGSGSSLYIQGINGLMEFDKGPLSGWMYSVNGKFLNKSVGEYRVKDGDNIRFQYTTNLGEDIGDKYVPNPTEENKGKSGGGGGGGSAKPKNNGESNVAIAALEESINKSANWILKNVDFTVHDEFNDWSALALQRAGKNVPTVYYTTLESYVKEKNGAFRLITDYERMALAVLALGKDPRNIAGYDFIEKIYQNERMTNQGTNGAIFALIVLDAKNYEVPADALWTREKLVNWVIEQQNADGGFPLSKASNGPSDVDVTAMALQALANYQDNPKVKVVIDKAVSWLSKQQIDNGGFKVYGVENSETISQVIIALTSLGIDLDDSRFVKKKGDLLSALNSFVNEDGGISHVRKEPSNYMATQQGLMAFTAYQRFIESKNNLFDMSDKNLETNKVTFLDVTDNSFGKDEIYQLVEAGVINGYPDGTFRPNQSINRGQAANLFMRALQLEVSTTTHNFDDVTPNSPYFDAANATKAAGIFNGKNDGKTFGALDTLTREQMASVLVRAFDLQPKDVQVNLTDLDQVSETHRKSVEILYQNGITTGRANGEFDPHAPVTRVQFVVFLSRAMKLTNN